ncbi:MAG: hypothetical protein M0R17_07250 [Candidatus Omnitrophica bacterium]|jgi:hypothetical protein|nr:hypothetical protein [Candidatus Omnitrophota bacterium]
MKCSKCGKETETCDRCMYEDDDFICEHYSNDYKDLDLDEKDFYCTRHNVLVCSNNSDNGVKLQ